MGRRIERDDAPRAPHSRTSAIERRRQDLDRCPIHAWPSPIEPARAARRRPTPRARRVDWTTGSWWPTFRPPAALGSGADVPGVGRAGPRDLHRAPHHAPAGREEGQLDRQAPGAPIRPARCREAVPTRGGTRRGPQGAPAVVRGRRSPAKPREPARRCAHRGSWTRTCPCRRESRTGGVRSRDTRDPARRRSRPA